MKKTFLVSLFLLISFFAMKAQELLSPNKKIKIELILSDTSVNSSYENVYFRVFYNFNSTYSEVLPKSILGINRTDASFTNNLQFKSESKPIEIVENYEMICGKRKYIENSAIEKTFSFVNSTNQPISIVFRAYNDGVAFRYEFPNSSDTLVNIINEATTYVFHDSTNRWTMPFEKSYEDFFSFSKTGISEKNVQEWGLPALFKINTNPVWVLLAEANLSELHCATKLSNAIQPNEYKVIYADTRENYSQQGVKAKLPWISQWHTLLIGSLSDIVESTLITDVSEAQKIENNDWIKPGAASWIYWANNHGSKDYKKVIEYIDLAVAMKWPYVLIDWEWDVMTNGGDITTAVAYAKAKGVKTLIWYNSGTSWLEPTPNDRLLTAEKRAKEFSWLNEQGIAGIKIDFFAGDQQDMIKFYIDLLEDAAKYKLVVNFHGATTPRGWARTYPNLLTTEAVYGAEWYNNNPILTPLAAIHNATLPFTRNVIGSMDYTPVTFSNSQHPHITSYGHELALSVVFESCVQHFADRPEAYYNLPQEPKEFLQKVPVSWDDTKLVDGYPGEKVIIARKKDNIWYIGGLNGKDIAQSLSLDFAFLGEGKYNIQVIKDGNDNLSFSTEYHTVSKRDSLIIECFPRGGFVATVELIK